jgi:transporter family protein
MERYGLAYALLAALLWGSAPVLEKLGLVKISPLAGLAIRTITITVILVVIALFTDMAKEIVRVDSRSLFFLVVSGIIAGLLGMLAYFKALKCWEASRVVPIVGAYPLFAFLFALLFLGEKLTLQKALGVLLVVSGVFLLG